MDNKELDNTQDEINKPGSGMIFYDVKTSRSNDVNNNVSDLYAKSLNNKVNNNSDIVFKNSNNDIIDGNIRLAPGDKPNTYNGLTNNVLDVLEEINHPDENKKNDEVLRLYIGENYDNITGKKFNTSGFLFSFVYLFYRKLFLFGILVFLANLLLVAIVRNIYFTILFNLIVGLFFNRVYLSYVKTKIKEIEDKSHDTQDIHDGCLKTGGTSLVSCIVGIIICIFTSLGVLFGFGIVSVKSVRDAINPPVSHFNGVVDFDKNVTVKNALGIFIPNTFINVSNEIYELEYKKGSGFLGSCYLRIGSLAGFRDSRLFMDEVASYYGAGTVKEFSSNDIDWNYYELSNGNRDSVYFATIIRRKLYYGEYIVTDNNDEECVAFKKGLFKSIVRK